MPETRHRYLVYDKSPTRMSVAGKGLLYVIVILLAMIYFLGFFWYGTQELESEREYVEEGS